MRSPIPKTEKNKRNCVVCGDVFYQFPSHGTVSCKKEECRTTRRSRSRTTHGMCSTRLYYIWREMRSRCASHDRYKHLSVCEAWQKFEPFRDWAIASGYSDGLEIDRKNNELGYYPDNCRWATRQQQMQNTRSRKGSTSQYKGVFLDRRSNSKSNPWQSQIRVNGKRKHLGCFATEEAAARAYDAAAKELHGEFACLNFKDGQP